MKIVADANLADVGQFARFGELMLVPGREIRAEHLLDAQALLVRSITPVGADLLAGSAVRFVGTATSGIDHIDRACLEARGITLCAAKGSNAAAVVDYCFAVLACCVLKQGLDLSGCEVGIVGCGHVGGLFCDKLRRLGFAVRLCDPPLVDAGIKARAGIPFVDLEEVFECRVVSLHVPLTRHSPNPTVQLVGAELLNRLERDAVLINTCRGGVVDEAALSALLSERDDVSCCFDVWADEPAVNPELVGRLALSTPHIAGYSQEAKRAATAQLCRGFEKAFSLQVFEDRVPADYAGEREEEGAAHYLRADSPWELVLKALPLEQLSLDFKASVRADDPVSVFDSLRRQLSARREFRSQFVDKQDLSADQCQVLSVLGFNLV